MFNLLFKSKSRFLSVGIAFLSYLSFVPMAQAFVSEDINKLHDEYCLNIPSCEGFDFDFPVNNNNLANMDVNNDNNDVISPQQKLLEDSLNLIDKIENPQVKAEMLINLAQQYYELNELEKTKQTLNEALEVSKNVEDESSKTLLMLKIATTYIEIQDLETASEILAEALQSSQEITDNSTKAALLMDLAFKYEQIGDSEKNENILAEVDTIVSEIENPPPSFPFQPLPLKGQIRLGTNLFVAEDTLANLNIETDFSKKWATSEVDLYVKLFNSYDSSRDSGDETRRLFDVITQYKYYLDEKKYLFANLGYLQDDFSKIDGKFSYFTGLGLNLWQGPTENQTFDMQLGVGDLFQNSDILNKDAPFPVFQYTLVFKELLFTDWKLEQYFTLELPVRNTANYFADSRTILIIPAINKWSIFASLNFKYYGIPELDEPNLSTRFSAGLTYDF